MSALLALIEGLIDFIFPPPGGSQRDIDARFDEIVKDFHNSV